jgi:hypothetical protein
MSLSRISNIEFSRAAVSDDVLRIYIRVLNCGGEEALELRKRANFTNSLKKGIESGVNYPPLLAMFEQFSDRLSPSAAIEIQRILERETGEQLASLAFSSNQRENSAIKTSKRNSIASLTPIRFAEICLLAESVRNWISPNSSPIDIGKALDTFCFREDNLDYRVVERLPPSFEGAFACIVGHECGHLILVEEQRFISASNGVYFARHVIAHELAHHFLHPQLLKGKGEVFLPTQELAKNKSSMIGSDHQIEQVVNTLEEKEAECFATFLLVPWEAYLKGTGVKYIADDYSEQKDEVKRYENYFKNEAVKDAFREALWKSNRRKHIIFSL